MAALMEEARVYQEMEMDALRNTATEDKRLKEFEIPVAEDENEWYGFDQFLISLIKDSGEVVTDRERLDECRKMAKSVMGLHEDECKEPEGTSVQEDVGDGNTNVLFTNNNKLKHLFKNP